MTVVLPSKVRAILRLNEPLFSPTDASSRLKTWQELTALGVLAVEFPTNGTRVWMRGDSRRDYDRAANPAKVAAWMAAQGVPVYGPDCPANLRSQVVHTDNVEFTMAASEAMKTGAKLWIRYDGRIRGEVTERVVTPLSWSELGLIARCHLRNEDRTFVVARILQWKPA